MGFGSGVGDPLLLQFSFAVYHVGLDYDPGTVAQHSPPRSRSAVVATIPDSYIVLFQSIQFTQRSCTETTLPHSPDQSQKAALIRNSTQNKRLFTPISAYQSTSPPILASIPQNILLNHLPPIHSHHHHLKAPHRLQKPNRASPPPHTHYPHNPKTPR